MILPGDQDLVVAMPRGRMRRWLKSDMRIMRWVFLGLYFALLVALALLIDIDIQATLIILAIMFAAQAIFIFGSGTVELCRPIRRRRLVLPVTVAALMLTVLLFGFLFAMIELTRLNKSDDAPLVVAFYGLLGVSWIGWGIVLMFHVLGMPRYRAIARLTGYLFAGSLAELVATVPAHIIVSRRPGCLVGMMTMVGICAGVMVMLFAFGPMIVLLFLRPRLRAESIDALNPRCPSCGYDLRATPDRCPECGLRIVKEQARVIISPAASGPSDRMESA